MNAERFRIDSEEDGFYMLVENDEGERWIFRISDPEALYDHVKGQIGPWLRERDEARALRDLTYGDGRPVFKCDPDESAGAYELSDPKHADHHSVHVDIWDAREGK